MWYEVIFNYFFETPGTHPLCFSKFASFNYPSYGNCYTFNKGNESHQVRIPGENFGPAFFYFHYLISDRIILLISGLKIILNVDQSEYVSTSTYTGFRVVMHMKDEPVYPDSMGFYVSPGYSTSVSFRLVN